MPWSLAVERRLTQTNHLFVSDQSKYRLHHISVLFFSLIPMIPAGASAAVLKPSDPVSEDAVPVQGPNFDQKLSFQDFLQSYERIGFQANSLGKAIDIVNKMVRRYQSP